MVFRNGGVDMVMFPLFPTLEVMGVAGKPDSVQDVEVVVLSSSGHGVDSAVPFPGLVGSSVTLASVPGGPPPSLPGTDECSSSQVDELDTPVPMGAVLVPVIAGCVELGHGPVLPCSGAVADRG